MNNPTNKTAGSSLFSFLMSKPYLLLVLAPIFWGGNISAGKLAVGNIDPYLLTIGRWSGALLILLPLALPHIIADWKQIKPKLPLLAMFGFFGFTVFNVLLYNSSLYTSAINGSIEQASIPVFVLIGNLILFGIRPKPLQVLGLILTIAGVVWVATRGLPATLLSLQLNIGDAMVIIACFLYAGYSLALKYKPKTHWLSFLAVTAFFALIAAFLAQVFVGGGLGELTKLVPQTTTRGWLLIIYVMIFPSILAQLFYARGVEMIGPNRASIFINLLPVFGTVISVLIVGEKFQFFHFVAAVLVVLGIIFSELSTRARTGTSVKS
ncbi:MAG: DMT family transporter [Devosiaceae bacterium]|nr:DMT family transporter [Devosiaceae bacterium]